MYCRACDYNLASLPAGQCPECARPFDPMDPGSYEAQPLRRVRKLQYAIAIGSAFAIGAVAWLGFRNGSPLLVSMIVIATGAFGLAASVVGIRLRSTASSRAVTLLAMTPAAGMLCLFYTLAIHMHRSLGGWPAVIGTRGFSPSLEAHAKLAFGCFSALLMINLAVLPVLLVLCFIVHCWRRGLFYLGVGTTAFVVAFGAMMLAPSPFLYWWWD